MEICDECGEEILPTEPSAMYDGELCHIICAAERMDEECFDDI